MCNTCGCKGAENFEAELYEAQYGSEEYDHVATMRKLVAWLKENNLEPSDIKGFTPEGHVILKPKNQRANYEKEQKKRIAQIKAQKKMYQDFLDNWDDEWEGNPPTFEEWKELVKDAEDWGGNPKGKLARALQKARENAKKPKKPLKIEKLDADSGWNMPPGVFSIPEPEHRGDYDLRHEYDYENYLDLELWKEAGLTEPEEYEEFYDRKEEEAKRIAEEEAKEKMERDKEDARNLGYACMYDEYPHEWEEAHHVKAGGFQCNACGEWRQTIEDDKNAETSGQWEIGEQLEEAQMNAEGKKRKKLSGQLSDPFDELSLDSGDWKGIVAGFGVGLLALFGYSKLRK